MLHNSPYKKVRIKEQILMSKVKVVSLEFQPPKTLATTCGTNVFGLFLENYQKYLCCTSRSLCETGKQYWNVQFVSTGTNSNCEVTHGSPEETTCPYYLRLAELKGTGE